MVNLDYDIYCIRTVCKTNHLDQQTAPFSDTGECPVSCFFLVFIPGDTRSSNKAEPRIDW